MTDYEKDLQDAIERAMKANKEKCEEVLTLSERRD